MTDTDISQLLDEIPLLYKARAFADSIDSAPVFSRLGESLSVPERHLARAYLDGPGFPEADPAMLGSWEEAADAAETLNVDPQGWEAEEMLRAGLVSRALERLDAEAVETLLSYVGVKAGEAAQSAVAYFSSLADLRDESLQNAAAGMLVQAANGAALVILSGDDEDEDDPHPFLARWRLFARGRWPVGLAGTSYNIL